MSNVLLSILPGADRQNKARLRKSDCTLGQYLMSFTFSANLNPLITIINVQYKLN